MEPFSAHALGQLLDFTLKVTLILSISYGATILLRKSAASTRHLLWKLGFTATLLLPLLTALLPAWRSSWLPSVFLGKVEALGSSSAASCANLFAPGGYLFFLTTSFDTPLGPTNLGSILVLLWFLVSTFFVTRLIFQSLLLQIVYLRGTSSTEISERLEALYHAEQDSKPPSLAVSSSIKTPMTFGFLKPKILLPTEALAWTQERLDVVLKHELAHISQKDYPFNLVNEIVCALQWHNPIVWMASKQSRLEREFAADDRVLSSGTGSIDYAEHLFHIASSQHANWMPNAAVGMSSSPLKHRVAKILKPGDRTRRTNKRHAFAVLLFSILLVLPIAAMQPCTSPCDGKQAVTPAKKDCKNNKTGQQSKAPQPPKKKCDKRAVKDS